MMAPSCFTFEVNRIHVDDRVYPLQRPFLPFFDQGYDLVGDVGNERRGDVNPIQMLQMILNLAGTDSLGVQGDNLIFDPCDIHLMLLHHDRLELSQPIPRDVDLLLVVLADQGFLAFPVAVVACGFHLDVMLLIAQVRIQFYFRHFLDRFRKQVFRSILSILDG